MQHLSEIKTMDNDNINKLIIELFYIKTVQKKHKCVYCKTFLQSKTYKLLHEFHKYLEISPYKYRFIELPCDWRWWLNEEYPDNDRDLFPRTVTKNFFRSIGEGIKSFPCIKITLTKNDNKFPDITFLDGIIEPEDDSVTTFSEGMWSFTIMRSIVEYLESGEISVANKKKITHDKAMLKFDLAGDPILKYDIELLENIPT